MSSEEKVYFGYKKISAKEKPQWVLRHFNSVADKYDLMNTLLSFGIHHLWKRTSVGIMGLKEGDRVLDICGGTGDLSVLAARKAGPSGRLFLYDINRAMMEAGRKKRVVSSFGQRIQFVQGDAERISFPDECFDAAMVGFGIRNLTYMDQGFKEIYRVLKPGGTFMCLEFSQPTSSWFRSLYDFYSFYIMPRVGELFAGSKRPYTHLPESIRTFPMPQVLIEGMEKTGFTQISSRKLTNGIAVVYRGRKD
jgi:demethylmenaquinone methyltransferase/2-methoxy-6-polyprenyl-1,4-benzoquinol methylase